MHPTYGVVSCKSCKGEQAVNFTNPDVINLSKLHRIHNQRDKHSKDLLQPYSGAKVNEDFFRAYPGKADEYGVRGELEKL